MEIKCRFCRKSEFRSHGFRKNKSGKKQVYKCLSCGRTFTQDTGFLKMRFEKEIIVKCLELFVSGMSVRKIAGYMERTEGTEVTHTTILRWKSKYGRMLKRYESGLKIENYGKSVIHCDETMLKVNGDYSYFWVSIDGGSRYVVSYVFSKRRGYPQAVKMFSECKSKMKRDPDIVTTDGLPTYPRAFKKIFLKRSLPRAYHMVSKGITAREDNNRVERVFGTVKDRTRTMRGGFGSLSSGSGFMNFFIPHYNFVRPHMSLDGKTPAEAAGIDLDLKGNKLLELIKRSADCYGDHKHRENEKVEEHIQSIENSAKSYHQTTIDRIAQGKE